jgi:hypothetical protein
MAEKKESAEATARTIRRVTRKKCIVSAGVPQVGGPARTHFFGPDGQGAARDPGSDVQAGCGRVGQPASGVAWREHMLPLSGRPPNGLELCCPAAVGNTYQDSTSSRRASQALPKAQGAGSVEDPGDLPGLQRGVECVTPRYSATAKASVPLNPGATRKGAARSPQVSSFRRRSVMVAHHPVSCAPLRPRSKKVNPRPATNPPMCAM